MFKNKSSSCRCYRNSSSGIVRAFLNEGAQVVGISRAQNLDELKNNITKT
ncbi:MAG: hypothetical protein IPP49_07665 [Saprospiraceae bacterium]|nr:hypothetical protein [Saprospiraceae bacterium]